MATVNFQLIGNNIYVNFSSGRDLKLRAKSGLTSKSDQWKQKKTKFSNKKTDLTSPTDADSKIIKSKLDDLENYILKMFNDDFSTGKLINKDWLESIIKKHNNQNDDEVEYLTFHIQKAIDDAPYKKIRTTGGRFKNGLSSGRIKGIIQFKNIIERFEQENLSGQKLKVKEISKETITIFERWMNNLGYSTNYIGKQQSNFKSILNGIEGIPININIKADIQVLTEEKEPEDIIYLSLDEINMIKELNLNENQNYLSNARKWLILGCFVGQRASDLLELSPDKIKVLNGRKVFALKQKKTGKKVTIPILPEADEVISSGFPRKISDTKLREYFKELCQLAELNELKSGRIKDSQNGITTVGKFPKWKLVGTHVCRRSFASNYYGKIPTTILKGITGHSTEQMFLKYIGKSDEDFAMQMFEYVEKLPQQSTLRILKNDKTGT